MQQHFIQQATMLLKSLFTNPNPNPNPHLATLAAKILMIDPYPNPNPLLATLSTKMNQIIHNMNYLIKKKQYQQMINISLDQTDAQYLS
jgi:hypothetical protein